MEHANGSTRDSRRERPDDLARHRLGQFSRRIGVLTAIVAALLLAGTVVLSLSENVGFWYAFRWALDTAATVGGFPQPSSVPGQIAQVALILLGVGTLFYALAVVAELFLAGHLAELLTLRRTRKMIDSLNDHHIVCGFGRVGRAVVRDLRASHADCVVLDQNAAHRSLAEALGAHFIAGDASDEAMLKEAGIARARSIIVCADSDSDNVFITLTARELRDDVSIVARSALEDTEKKLKRAGADRVISPYKTSGTEMARLAMHRVLSGVIDVDPHYRLEEIEIAERGSGPGRTVGDIRGDSMIVGLRRGAVFEPQPPSDTVLAAGDTIVALGTAETLERLEGLLEGAGL